MFTEAFGDVSFRLAPITEADASEMLDEIKGKALLGPFRGESPADRQALIRTPDRDFRHRSRAPGGGGNRHQPVAGGTRRGGPGRGRPLRDGGNRHRTALEKTGGPADIGALFYPKSIAFVGASAQIGKWGNMLLANTISKRIRRRDLPGQSKGRHHRRPGGYTGQWKRFPAMWTWPWWTIPAAGVMALIAPMARKGIRNMLLITSGFGETGAAGKAMEKQMVTAAEDAGILVLGPNTMGICNPHINLYCTGSPVMPRAGSTAMVAQSGNMGTQLMGLCRRPGDRCSGLFPARATKP